MHLSLGMDEFQRKPEPVITKQEIFPLISTKWVGGSEHPVIPQLLAIKGEFTTNQACKEVGMARDSVRAHLLTLVKAGKVGKRNNAKRRFNGGARENIYWVIK